MGDVTWTNSALTGLFAERSKMECSCSDLRLSVMCIEKHRWWKLVYWWWCWCV